MCNCSTCRCYCCCYSDYWHSQNLSGLTRGGTAMNWAAGPGVQVYWVGRWLYHNTACSKSLLSKSNALIAKTIVSGKFSMFPLVPTLTTELYCPGGSNCSPNLPLGIVCGYPTGFPIWTCIPDPSYSVPCSSSPHRQKEALHTNAGDCDSIQ